MTNLSLEKYQSCKQSRHNGNPFTPEGRKKLLWTKPFPTASETRRPCVWDRVPRGDEGGSRVATGKSQSWGHHQEKAQAGRQANASTYLYFLTIYKFGEQKIHLTSIKMKCQIEGFQVALWRRQWHPTPVLLPGKSHGWRSLVGCSPWGR